MDGLRAAADLGELAAATPPGTAVLGADAVASVVRGLLDQRWSSAEVQAWASFVKRGYLEGEGPRFPIEISYSHIEEDGIVAAINRLDELGDRVDGDIDAAEARELLDTLDRSRDVH